MKEITLRLTSEIGEFIASDAKMKGLTSEELLKYVVGSYVQAQHEARAAQFGMPAVVMGGIAGFFDSILKDLNKTGEEHLIARANAGELTCKNCTMKLTEQDIKNRKCGTCDAPIKDALGGSM